MSENTTNDIVPVEITVETLKAKIYMIRGQRVMLAADKLKYTDIQQRRLISR